MLTYDNYTLKTSDIHTITNKVDVYKRISISV